MIKQGCFNSVGGAILYTANTAFSYHSPWQIIVFFSVIFGLPSLGNVKTKRESLSQEDDGNPLFSILLYLDAQNDISTNNNVRS